LIELQQFARDRGTVEMGVEACTFAFISAMLINQESGVSARTVFILRKIFRISFFYFTLFVYPVSNSTPDSHLVFLVAMECLMIVTFACVFQKYVDTLERMHAL
jgi:hypothetical protein